MRFGDALTALQDNDVEYMYLPIWNPDVKIKLQTPDEHSKMTAPYLYVESRFGNVPWNPTQIELLSNDWETADE